MDYRLGKLPVFIQVFVSSWSYWWDALTSLILVCIIWALCWLTIVFGPPATFGLFHVAYSLIEGESTGISGLIEGSKRYFLRSWLWMILNFLVIFVLFNAINFYVQVDRFMTGILSGVFTAMLVMWLIVQLYTIPYFLRQEKESIFMALRNSLFTALASPLYTLGIAAVAGGLLVLSVVTIIPIFLGVPAFAVILQTNAVKERISTFQEIIGPKDKE